ncbi:ParA family protein [Candidatus Paracaedibacter symbiosus]|uniref:ParA family protein n=1 Tax=Candidatus Paracaedibacter symbiosus TaxID=244582 RepID=UPI0005095822|nr:ParA family protein [Candidatus Paracaedibacter symbiosus]
MGKVITLATSKGGAGKSTLARNIAAHWLNVGMRVAVIDADPQGSIIKRHDPNGLLSKLVVIAQPEEIVDSTINELKTDYDYIIVDTGGFRNRTTVKALISTDLAIIPLKPSADDVAGALETHNLIKEINKTPERLSNPIRYKMIITMSQQGTVIARHVRSELEQIGYLVLKAEMYHRVAYPEAAIKGLSPCITDPEGAAARDIAQIISEVDDFIAK